MTIQRFTVAAAVFLACFLGIPPASPAASDPGESPWTRTETTHFTIFSQAGYDVGVRVGADLERLHHAVTALTDSSKLEAPLPNFFYIFRDEESLAPYRQPGSFARAAARQPMVGMKVIGGAPNAGYLVPHEHGNYAVVVGGDDFVPTRYVYKQYIHHLLHEDYQRFPHWLLQGIAEYFSAFKTEGDYALLGMPSEDHLNWIRYHSTVLMPMAELLSMDQGQIYQRSLVLQNTYFKQSWALFHYLVYRDPDSRQQLALFIGKLTAGTSSAEAFDQVYGLDLETLGSELDAYLSKGTLSYLKVPVQKLNVLSLKSTDLEPHEIEYHLGDLAARAVKGGAPLAEAHFRRALAASPEFGPAWAGLGYLATMASNHEIALQHHAKAATYDPDDFRSIFLYGKSLLRSLEGRRPANASEQEVLDSAIAALSKSVELNDGVGQAWADLGYAYGLHSDVPDTGLEALRRALEFYPQRSDLALNLLLAHARRGERAEANNVMERMESSDTGPETLDRAREILLQMDYGEAAGKARAGQTDQAIALFAQIQSETRDAALKETVEEQLAKLSNINDLQDFFDLYDEVAAAINSGEMAKAQELVDRLAERAGQSWQRGQVKKLKRILTLAGSEAPSGDAS